jgi:hypothetical protein
VKEYERKELSPEQCRQCRTARAWRSVSFLRSLQALADFDRQGLPREEADDRPRAEVPSVLQLVSDESQAPGLALADD